MIHLYIVILRGLVWLADVAMTAATRWTLFIVGPFWRHAIKYHLKGRVINIDWLTPIIGLRKYKSELFGEAIAHAIDQLMEDET